MTSLAWGLLRLAGGVHPGVAQGLGKLVDFSESRAPSHTEVAVVRPRLPLVGAPQEQRSGRGCVKERHQKLSAFSFYVVRQLELLRHRPRVM